ncbi:hypothetical protein XANCAGTX0491_003591 [Xanthoria calcicola]
MVLRESQKKPTFFIGLTIFFILSLILLQRNHDPLRQTEVNTNKSAGSNPLTKERTTAFPASKQTRLPEASLKALQNQTLGVCWFFIVSMDVELIKPL